MQARRRQAPAGGSSAPAAQQSAPTLRRKKRSSGGTVCTPQVLTFGLIVGGFFLLAIVGLVYEFSKSPTPANNNAQQQQQQLRNQNANAAGHKLPQAVGAGAVAAAQRRAVKIKKRLQAEDADAWKEKEASEHFHVMGDPKPAAHEQAAAAAQQPPPPPAKQEAEAQAQQQQRREQQSKEEEQGDGNNAEAGEEEEGQPMAAADNSGIDHLNPLVPVLPIFAPVVSDSVEQDALIAATLDESRPTLAGVTAIMQTFLEKLHVSQQTMAAAEGALTGKNVIDKFFDLTEHHLAPLERKYRGKTIFPVREDDSIYLSLAAYREHLLAETMMYAFSHAKHPEKLFVGAVVQNCFGTVSADGKTIDTSGLPCKTGFQVVGKRANGRDQVKVSDAPPDVNGVADFCAQPEYRQYCDNGQVRVLYVHESESQGPAMARYYASRLWGGETYFVQCDAHLQFAKEWDRKYIEEIKATRNYPKSVLSSYPPGFTGHGSHDGTVRESNGARLCACETRLDDPNPIVRLGTGRGYMGGEPRPTQIPFIAAGFFFARAEFLRDVPFDPYIPYCFMGEEMALSMRAWTQGWDIYAPRKNLIAHQYRPGRLGLPKFWETVNRLFRGKTGLNEIQHIMIQRIKHMVGYPSESKDKIVERGLDILLTDLDLYGIGSQRSWQEYMDFANLHIDQEHDAIACSAIPWCNHGEKD